MARDEKSQNGCELTPHSYLDPRLIVADPLQLPVEVMPSRNTLPKNN
jgi:hypothetical protein